VQILKLKLPSGDLACFIVRQPVINGTAAVSSVRASAAAAGDTDNSEVMYCVCVCDASLNNRRSLSLPMHRSTHTKHLIDSLSFPHVLVFSAHLTTLERAVAKDYSVCLSVSLSIYHIFHRVQ